MVRVTPGNGGVFLPSWPRRLGYSESTRYPCAMVAPNGDSTRARSGSTWIHWWSPVASANRSIRSWVIVTHELT